MKEIISQELVMKTLKRMAHEIIEQNSDLTSVVLVGILRKGLPIAHILQANLKRFSDIDVPVYAMDISGHRDDQKKATTAQIAFNIQDKNVIIVDDVLYTGRSVRACMDALVELGRPKRIQLAALVDRGHRELPIRADYIGKNLPTAHHEQVIVDTQNLNVYIK